MEEKLCPVCNTYVLDIDSCIRCGKYSELWNNSFKLNNNLIEQGIIELQLFDNVLFKTGLKNVGFFIIIDNIHSFVLNRCDEKDIKTLKLELLKYNISCDEFLRKIKSEAEKPHSIVNDYIIAK